MSAADCMPLAVPNPMKIIVIALSAIFGILVAQTAGTDQPLLNDQQATAAFFKIAFTGHTLKA
jgi:hypothetical protein